LVAPAQQLFEVEAEHPLFGPFGAVGEDPLAVPEGEDEAGRILLLEGVRDQAFDGVFVEVVEIQPRGVVGHDEVLFGKKGARQQALVVAVACGNGQGSTAGAHRRRDRRPPGGGWGPASIWRWMGRSA
jgi:hypothetical protein